MVKKNDEMMAKINKRKENSTKNLTPLEKSVKFQNVNIQYLKLAKGIEFKASQHTKIKNWYNK